MKRQQPSKPRTTSLTMDMGKPVDIKSFKIKQDSTCEFFDENGARVQPIDAYVERSYGRKKGPKVLSRTPIHTKSSLTVDPLKALLEYDVLYILDSNTKYINGRNVSIAATILAQWSQRKPEIRLKFAPMYAMEFWDSDCHPDLLALRYFISLLGKNPTIQRAGKIGFIIDSHLGDFHLMRSRESPILDDFYLPSWVDLIFATDVAQDNLVNRLLKRADKEASNLLSLIESGVIQDSPSLNENFGHASYLRFWRR